MDKTMSICVFPHNVNLYIQLSHHILHKLKFRIQIVEKDISRIHSLLLHVQAAEKGGNGKAILFIYNVFSEYHHRTKEYVFI